MSDRPASRAGAPIVLTAPLAESIDHAGFFICYPDQLPDFIGERTRVVPVSTHNPLGTTFAAGVYASIFGSSREPVNALWRQAIADARTGKLASGARVLKMAAV